MNKKDETRVRVGVPLNLKKRNEWFDALKPKEKRIEVMKEIIWALSLGYFSASCGYFSLSTKFGGEALKGGQIQSELQVHKEKGTNVNCSGCEIAALLYARIRLGNQEWLEEYEEYHVYREKEEIYELLKGIFSDKQLRLMETAYERTNYMYNEDPDYGRTKDVVEFYYNVYKAKSSMYHNKHSNKSMADIAENVIAHNGTFKPFDLKYLKK